MWLSTPSLDSVTRPRIALAVVYAAAAASIGYYAYTTASRASEATPTQGLHRSNAVRRSRRSRRSRTQSSSSSEIVGDENIEVPLAEPLEDSETFVGEGEDAWWDDHGEAATGQQRAGHNIVNLLFRVSEDNARRNGCVHRGCQCNSCGMAPIRGVRYRCVNCADFDLCETCESQGMHTKAHIFYKIKVPVPPFSPRQMQPVWYTGDPDSCHRNLPKNLIPRLTATTGFERPELEAFWEQWTFMANTEWRNDPDGLYLTMDRKTFERCLVPTGGSRHAAPNLIHDRMFAFYDEDKDGYISFEEFLKGLAYRKQKDKLEKVFQGYDIDGDGLVNRKDFLRMFRAYYVLYKQMHRDILDGLEDQVISSTEAQQLIASRQPLSGLFGREGGISRGDTSFRLEGKTIHSNGHIDLEDGRGPVAENRGDTASRQDILTSLFACETDQRSRWRALARAAAGDDLDQPRHSHVSDADRPYLVTLLEPPSNLDDLPDAVMGEVTLELDETTSSNGDEDEDHRDVRNESYIESLIGAQMYSRRKTTEAEKRRRDMARTRLHDRWKRRQFYLDEEEGGQEPDDWNPSEDILADGVDNGESSKASLVNDARSSTYQPADDQLGTGNWGKVFIPGPERDAGREILYQVTQQAFNELLDTIFKPSEDIAVRARETREQRERHKEAIEAFGLSEDEQQDHEEAPTPPEYNVTTPGPDPRERYHASTPGPNSSERSLQQLLNETGYSVVDPPEPRNGVDLDDASHPRGERSHDAEEEDSTSDSDSNFDSTESFDGFDPTLPQFRPDTMTWDEMHRLDRVTYPVTRPHASRRVSQEPELTAEILQDWKVLTQAEEKARSRGGWGRLNFAEFEEIYRSQEYQGNRLDYLGSWIDFCIP